MPLPKPKTGENEEDFISRCMGNPTMKDDYPEQKQRLAVCYSRWKEKKMIKTRENRKVIPYKDHGTAEENTPWNGGAETKACEVDDLKVICTWYDAEDEENKGAYKLPHHRASDKKAVWKAVSAAMGALLGARGGVDIPAGDRRGVYNHLSKHYGEFEKDVPDFRSAFMSEPERRYISASELRADEDKMEITGYAAMFGVYSEKLGFFKERIRQGAFAQTIKGGDIRALFNHDPNYVLGRTRNKTLELWEDDKGLGFSAKLPDTSYARDLVVNINDKNITQNSFGFKTVQDEWSKDGAKRDLIEVELFDLGPVTFPAYPQTSVKVRTMIYDYGIDYDELVMVMLKHDRKIELTEDDIGLVRSTVGILNSIVLDGEEEPVSDHSEPCSQEPPGDFPDVATLARLRHRMMRLRMSKKIA